MNGLASLMGIFNNDLALVVGGESFWVVSARERRIEKVPAYLAIHKEGKRVMAVGEEARKLKGREPAGVNVLRVTQFGGFEELDVAEAAVRVLFRKMSSPWRVAPRVLVACPQMSKMNIKAVLIAAGARDLITLPATMAAAIGAGLSVEKHEMQSVFVLERDWCAFAVVSQSAIVASFERRGGVEQLLEDVAVHALATNGIVLDPEALHDLVGAKGLVGPERLAAKAGQPGEEVDIGRHSRPFMHRLDLYHRQALSGLSSAQMLEAFDRPLHFCGPYAGLPGMGDLVENAFHQKVTVLPGAEEAMIRGTQQVLADLSSLMSGFK